jgi:hypothetical protein
MPHIQSIDPDLDMAIMTITAKLLPAGYEVSHEAPQSYEALRVRLDAGRRMRVWNGGSGWTIYGNAAINFAFRAWHDLCHYIGCHDFTLKGEIDTCELQCRQLADHFRGMARVPEWQATIRAEVIGQALYFHRNKRFPDDQRGFVLAYLADPVDSIPWPLW